jgi:hypothetical protein
MRQSFISRQIAVIKARNIVTCLGAVPSIRPNGDAEFIKLRRQMELAGTFNMIYQDSKSNLTIYSHQTEIMHVIMSVRRPQ